VVARVERLAGGAAEQRRLLDVPEPSSLMSGPAATESLWALTTTVRSGSPTGESPITLYVVRVAFTVLVAMWAAGA
jgi:hypothetical protein